ncbi:MAG: hypothetical protein ACRC46_07500 [Thermoguttaceae bacterium]
MKKIFAFTLCLVVALLVGCNNKASVKGKVTLTDGAPLTKGRVVFSTPKSQAIGIIQKDGTYTMEEDGRGTDLPPGEYAVAVNAAESTETGQIYHAHPKFANPETSGLKFTVPSSSGYDITVEPPPAQAAQPARKGRVNEP